MNSNNNNQSNLIKLQFNNEVRRFRIENESFANFVTVLEGILNVNPTDYEFFYIDAEGDQIKFSSDIEFSYALSSSPSPLRVIMKKLAVDNDNNNNNGDDKMKLREVICEVDQKSIAELKEKIKEINQRIRSTKEQMKEIKMRRKERKGEKKRGYFEESTEEDKKDKLALFQFALELYELKLIKRSLFLQFKSQNKNCKREMTCQSSETSGGEQVEFTQLRQSIWELKEKAKTIKVQIRSVKLLMNAMNSETQKEDLQKQLNDLKAQLVKLKEEKFQLCSMFRQRRKSINEQNHINGGNCPRKWMRMEMSEEEREVRRNEFKARRNQMIDIKKRIIQIKSIKDFQKNDELMGEIKQLKEQFQSLKQEQKAHWKRNHPCPHKLHDQTNQ